MLEKLKQLPVVSFFYNLPYARQAYHFLLSLWGAAFYGYPSKKIFVIGVTGTKGKTTTLELVGAILEAAGKKTALLSSLRVKIGEESEKNKIGNSMPGRFFIQKFLKKSVDAGCTYALIEVTSEGVALSRHRFIDWNMAVLTNLAPEHIEAHGTFEKYRAAKLSFLRYVTERSGKVFLNRDDDNFQFFTQELAGQHPVIYSADDEKLRGVFPQPTPMRAVVDDRPPKFILSDFNRENVAAAVALAKNLGIEDGRIKEALNNFQGVPGRMEFLQWKPFAVVIDYAHTVESLEAVYRALRGFITNNPSPITNANPYGYKSSVISHKLIGVLGAAGGGRDKWKRPAMGKVAAKYCEKIFLTNEDPYDEDPSEIIDQVAAGFARVPGAEYRAPNFEKVLDRREAIRRAIEMAREGDVVVATGKGSEDWIHEQGGRKTPWNEREVAEEALRSRRAEEE